MWTKQWWLFPKDTIEVQKVITQAKEAYNKQEWDENNYDSILEQKQKFINKFVSNYNTLANKNYIKDRLFWELWLTRWQQNKWKWEESQKPKKAEKKPTPKKKPRSFHHLPQLIK